MVYNRKELSTFEERFKHAWMEKIEKTLQNLSEYLIVL